MPVYRVVTQKDSLTTAQREAIAERIVEMHLRLAGGLRAFVNVMFEEYPRGSVYVGGRLGEPAYLVGAIRAGRSEDIKREILQELSDLFVAVTDFPVARLLVNVAEVKASNSMEAGHVLPEPGEEEAWLRKVGAAFEAA